MDAPVQSAIGASSQNTSLEHRVFVRSDFTFSRYLPAIMRWGPDDDILFLDSPGNYLLYSLSVRDIQNFAPATLIHHYRISLAGNRRLDIIFNPYDTTSLLDYAVKTRINRLLTQNNYLVKRYIFKQKTIGGLPVAEVAWLTKLHEHGVPTVYFTQRRLKAILVVLIVFLATLVLVIFFTE